MQLDFSAGALLSGIDNAGIEGAGIDVQADGALAEFARIEDPVDGLERVDRAGLRHIHFNNFSGLESALAASNVLMHDVKILHQ